MNYEVIGYIPLKYLPKNWKKIARLVESRSEISICGLPDLVPCDKGLCFSDVIGNACLEEVLYLLRTFAEKLGSEAIYRIRRW